MPNRWISPPRASRRGSGDAERDMRPLRVAVFDGMVDPPAGRVGSRVSSPDGNERTPATAPVLAATLQPGQGSVSAGCERRTPRGRRVPRACRSARTRAGNGCLGGRRREPGSSRTPVASTSCAAHSSMRTPGTVRRGKPIEPPRGRTQVNRSAQSSKKPSSRARLAATIPRDRASTRSRARSPMSARISDGAAEQIVV